MDCDSDDFVSSDVALITLMAELAFSPVVAPLVSPASSVTFVQIQQI